MAINKFFGLLLCVSWVYAGASVPKIILHVDVNKTIMAEDPAGGKSVSDVLIGALAETYEDRWDSTITHPMSYKEYVDTHLFPGAKGDQELKKLRNAQVARFIEYLAETNHPLHSEIQGRYARLLAKLNNHESIIFPSFFAAIRYLDAHAIPYSIVLRTFGKDLDRVMDEFDCCLAPRFFSWKGEFNESILTMTSLDSGEIVILRTTAEVYAFLQTHGNVAIHDDWNYWNKHGECKEYGKLFPIDVWDPHVICLFADDNANPKDGILNPRHPVTNESLDVEFLIADDYIRVVNTLEAIEDDDYFIHYVLMAIWWYANKPKKDWAFRRDKKDWVFGEDIDWENVPLLFHPGDLDWRYFTISID